MFSRGFCPIKRFTGIPCPGCGMTRAWASALKGDITSAFMYHPLFFTMPLLAALIIMYVRKPGRRIEISLYIIAGLYIAVYVIRLFSGWRG